MEQPQFFDMVGDKLAELVGMARQRMEWKPASAENLQTFATRVPAGNTIDLLPMDANRKRIRIIATAADLFVGAREDVETGAGYPIPATASNAPLEIKSIAKLSVKGGAADATVYQIIEYR